MVYTFYLLRSRKYLGTAYVSGGKIIHTGDEGFHRLFEEGAQGKAGWAVPSDPAEKYFQAVVDECNRGTTIVAVPEGQGLKVTMP